MCTSDGLPVFKHETDDIYIYSLESGGTNFWLVASRVGGDYKLLGINTGDSNCPGSDSTPTWYVRASSDGSNPLTDNVVVTSI